MRYLIALFLVFAAAPALAFGYCVKPREPSCPILGRFTSELDFQMCRNEVEGYVSDMQEYVNCLFDEAEQARIEAEREQREAQSKVDDVIERFNCYARGDQFCY